MRIFVGGLSTETNSFSPWPTGRKAFESTLLFRGLSQGESGEAKLSRRLAELAAADGHQLFVGLMARAEPAGLTVQAVYEEFRDELIESVWNNGPFDIILLFLHGAMAASSQPDCEGDLLARMREACGPRAAIGVELDPHSSLSAAMIENSDLVMLMKEYPHSDYVERAQELYQTCVDIAAERVRPVSAVFDCRMVGFYPTTVEPMAGVVRKMREIESRPGVLSVSFVHGFPWADTPDAGSKVLAVSDGDAALAVAAAEELGWEVYGLREAFQPQFPSIDQALDLALAEAGVTVMADFGDNPGGGAPSDNVTLLRALLARNITGAAFGSVWDPVVAELCAEAGIGARLAIRLGGKCGPASGDPLDLIATVRGVRADHIQGGMGEERTQMGLSVWIETEGVDVAINSIRTQVFTPEAFTGLGIELGAKRVIAVKSSQHFRTAFAPLADQIILVKTPGALQMDFAALPYRERDLGYFPRIQDPLDRDTRAQVIRAVRRS